MNDFENLLNASISSVPVSSLEYRLNKGDEVTNTNITTSRQKADKNAELFDFIKMIDTLVKLTMENTEFIPDERKIHSLDVMKNIDKPIISYRVLGRKPKMEIKPRIREEIEENNPVTNEKILGEVWGQKFECYIQFDLIGSVYTEAEQVMNKFEELMFKYTGFFKKNGVAELIFDKHLTDESFDNLRESYSVRSLIYRVEVEKLIVVFKHEIEEIELLAQKIINKEE